MDGGEFNETCFFSPGCGFCRDFVAISGVISWDEVYVSLMINNCIYFL